MATSKSTLYLLPLIMFFVLSTSYCFCQTHVTYNWVQCFGKPDHNKDCAIIVDHSGNTYFTGNTLSPKQGVDILIVKYNKEGKLIWQKTYNHPSNGNDYGKDVISDPFGNIYVAGTSEIDLQGRCSITLIKINNNDTIEWHQHYNYVTDTNNVKVVVDKDLNIIATASGSNPTSGCDFITSKYSPTGKLMWSTTYDFCRLDDIPIGIVVNRDNEVLVTGISYLNDSTSRITTLKYDSEGNEILIRHETNQQGSLDQPIGLDKDNEGNYLLVGKIKDSTANYNIRTMKLGHDLRLLWSMDYDGYLMTDEPTDLFIDFKNDVIVTGFSEKENCEKEWITIKYSKYGDEIWIDKKNINSISSSLEGVVCTDAKNNILLIHSDNTLGDNIIQASLSNPDNAFIWAMCYSRNEKGKEIPIDVLPVDDFKFNVIGYNSDNTNEYFLLQYKYFHIDNREILNPSSRSGYYKNNILIRFNPKYLELKPYNPHTAKFKEISSYLGRNQLKRIMKRMPDNVITENIWMKRIGKNRFLMVLECDGKEKEIAKSLSKVFPIVQGASLNSFGRFDLMWESN